MPLLPEIACSLLDNAAESKQVPARVRLNNSVSHFLGEQLSHGEIYKNLVDCVLSHTILKI